jgi:hypothetical protein
MKSNPMDVFPLRVDVRHAALRVRVSLLLVLPNHI